MIFRTTIILVLALLGLPPALPAQCSGTLGENIFPGGDFGAGTENIIQEDPRIAPGFSYERNPPPVDGFYTITNNTGGTGWGGIYLTWDRFFDNSSDPNGYMMVVNSSFSPGIFYEQTVNGLCGNTDYFFSADIRNMLKIGQPGSDPDVSFLIDDEVQFSTGNVPKDQRWNNYGFSFRTDPDQTTVKLSLRNNAPGGNGNDLALDNIAFRACGPEAGITAVREVIGTCEDGGTTVIEARIIGGQFDTPAIQWQVSPDGVSGWEAIEGARQPILRAEQVRLGSSFYRYLVAASTTNLTNSKCRIISDVRTITTEATGFERVDTICAGGSLQVGDSFYDRAGVYTDTLTSRLGCDSIVTTQLAVVPDPGLTAFITDISPLCQGVDDGIIRLDSAAGGAAPYRFLLDDLPAGRTYDGLASGSYTYRLVDRVGCESAGAIILEEPDPYTVDLGEDRTVTLGESVSVQVVSTDVTTAFTLDPPEVPCDTPCTQILLFPANSLHLRYRAQSQNGCIATDSIRITVNKLRDVYLPTAFSPNDDGVNDEFLPQSDQSRVVEVAYLRVYDRWGSLVFERENFAINDRTMGWDGTHEGRALPLGTYAYVTAITYLDGETHRLSGDVTLLR